ncbi:NTP transferase domain-containing protein [bacterium]|nr:NTP transferase domain-containing protein [bacterium]
MTDFKDEHTKVMEAVERFSSRLNPNENIISIILAAGHGKRIKSEISKMLHTIWGKPSILRVSDSVKQGLNVQNQIIVVGKKGKEVIEALGEKRNTCYAYQKDQKGTGHAAKTALDTLPAELNKKIKAIFVFPGDMGLISSEAVEKVKDDFFHSNYDMIIMTGKYYGNPMENYYGRVVRVPRLDINGNVSPNAGEVIEIIEFKDILNIDDEKGYTVAHKERKYHLSKKELLETGEFNAGVYGFKSESLISNINTIKSDNVQSEIYLTDLVSILNKSGFQVGISEADDNEAILGFNVKSVLKTMQSIACKRIYNRLKDIITITDEEDFFIDDQVVERIIELDKQGNALDIAIESGVYIGPNVHLNKGLHLDKNAVIKGNVEIGEGTFIGTGCTMDTYENQKIVVGKGCQFLTGTVIRGNVAIGDNVRIESGVRITGSDEYPVVIEPNVLIKGITYIFGSIVEEGVEIEHCVLKTKRVIAIRRKNGTIQPIRYFLPLPVGLDSLEML